MLWNTSVFSSAEKQIDNEGNPTVDKLFYMYLEELNNQILRNSFGSGDDKTIKDWKNFLNVDTQIEENDTTTFEINDGLYNVPDIQAVKSENKNIKLEFTINNMYNKNNEENENTDFINRWEK